MLGDLYDSGNQAAVTAYQDAYQKMLGSGVPEFDLIPGTDENSALFQNLLDLEALRLYALSGTGEEYRAE